MLECVVCVAAKPTAESKTRLHQLIEALSKLRVRHLCNTSNKCVREFPPDHCADLSNLLSDGHSIETRQQRCLQGGRHRDGGRFHLGLRGCLHYCLGQLLDKERHPI